MSAKKLTKVMCVLILGLLATCPSLAQESRGNLSGRVSDPSGAAVAGASVQVTNTKTGVTIPATTNNQGLFTVPFLVPSIYSVAVEHPGFKRVVRSNVEIQVGASIQLDISLTVGETSQHVQVTAAPPLLHTATASLGTVIGTKQIQELPNAGGNVAELANLAAGVATGGGIAIHYAAFNNGTSQIVSDGNPLFANEWTIDGVPNVFASGTVPRIAFSPPPMVISEFKVMTLFYDAALGHTSGAIINMNTQSGTSHYHGELHEFFGSNWLTANTFFAKRAGQKPAAYTANRYGGAIGGPVHIPHLYNGNKGAKKTFFYFAYEGERWGTPGTFTGTVPTAAERNGDFSSLLALGPNYTIYNPFSTVSLGNGLFQRTAFPGNKIPTQMLSATALNLLKLYPMPNTQGTADGRDNYTIGNVPDIERYHTYFVRFDHTFSERSRMFLRMDYDDWDERELEYYGATNPASGNHTNRNDAGLALDEVYVINPSTIFDFRYGITAQMFPNRPLNPTNLSQYGFSPSFTSLFPATAAQLPTITFDNYSQLGDVIGNGSYQSSLIHSFSGSITQLIRTHNLHYGIDYRIERANGGSIYQNSADLNFDSTYTNGPFSTSAASPIGQGLASFLVGVPGSGGTVSTNSSYADQDLWLGVYLQDDWRATQKLTLNLGFRIEHETPVTERYNRANMSFDDTTVNPISAAATANYAADPMPGLPPADFKVLGGLRFAGGSNGRGFWDGQAIEPMPRIGFAYNATPKTVLRGGFGVFYDTIGVYRSVALQNGFSSTTPVISSLDNGLTYTASVDNPVPNGLIKPLGAAGGLATALGQPLEVYAAKRSIPYSQRWSLTIERELPGTYILDASYVGNRGVHLPITREINNTPAGDLSTLPSRDQATINFLNQTFSNPFFGLASSYTETATRAQLLTPYPEFDAISVTTDGGRSNYNALQLSLSKRFSHGYSLNVAYTFSRLMDATSYLNPTDPLPWYGVSTYDRPEQIRITNLVDLPFGRGQAIGGGMPRWANFVAGGWHLNTIVSFQSGAPLTWGNVIYTGNLSDIRLSAGDRSISHWFNTSGFNTNSSQQLADNIRTFPLRLSNVRSDAQYLWSFSLAKDFPVHNDIRLQLRGEAYNALNHPNMNAPSVSPTSSTFGVVSSQDGFSRTINIAMRLLF